MIPLCLCVNPSDPSHVVTFICRILRLRKLELPRLYLPIQVLFIFAKKWQLSCQQDEKYDSECPHIGRVAIVVPFSGNVRVHVVGGPAEQSQFLLSSSFDAKPEIYNLDSILFTWIDQNVI